MAGLSVLPRPVGSALFLRFVGTILPGAALAAYPKANGTFSSDAIAATTVYVARVLMADPLDLTNPMTQLPLIAFDNTQPAGSAPVVPTASGALAPTLADILNGTDLDMSDQAWAQNVHITVEPTDHATGLVPLVWNAAQAKFCVDAPNSGLGGNTGFPVLCLALDLGAQPPQSVSVLITVEVRHSVSR